MLTGPSCSSDRGLSGSVGRDERWRDDARREDEEKEDERRVFMVRDEDGSVEDRVCDFVGVYGGNAEDVVAQFFATSETVADGERMMMTTVEREQEEHSLSTGSYRRMRSSCVR